MLAGLILAGGASERMGVPKPLLELEGETFLDRVIASLQAAMPRRFRPAANGRIWSNSFGTLSPSRGSSARFSAGFARCPAALRASSSRRPTTL